MINILVIAGEYPPLKTIGRIRTAKFVEHWHNAGYNPIVLTIGYAKEDANYEASLEAEIPEGVPIYRVHNHRREDKPLDLIKKILGRTSNAAQPRDVHNEGQHTTKQVQTSATETSTKESISSKLITVYKRLFRLWIDIPDDYVDWADKSFDQALKIVESHKIDVIYTSFPPFSACKLGFRLKNTTKLPWVVDYRDLWTGDVLREWVPKVRAWYETKLEKKYVSAADAVITVSEQKTEFLKQLLPPSQQVFKTITNGYDTESFATLLDDAQQQPKTSEALNIVYCGRLFKNRKGYAFLNAMGQIYQDNPSLLNKVKVHYYGGIEDVILKEYQKIIATYQLQDHVVCHGDVSFEAAKKAQVEADILLLIVDTGATSDGVIPGKLFEYVAAKKPIFALSEASATNHILKAGRLGTVLSPNDLAQCKSALQDVLEKRDILKDYNPDLAYIEKFDRKALAAEMIDVFSTLVARG